MSIIFTYYYGLLLNLFPLTRQFGESNHSLLTEFRYYKFLINSSVYASTKHLAQYMGDGRFLYIIFSSVILSRISLIASSSRVRTQQLVYWLIKRTLYGVKIPQGRQTCKSRHHNSGGGGSSSRCTRPPIIWRKKKKK